MGRPSAVPVALVACLLLLPAPASSAGAGAGAAAAARAIARSPLVKRLFVGASKMARWQGTPDVITQAPKRNRDTDQRGGAAADDYGFVVHSVSIGAQTISGVVDITSDLVWAQCDPCSTDCLPPVFRPADSSSFSKAPCDSPTCHDVLHDTDTCAADGSSNDDGCQYIYTYNDDYSTSGYIATETFTATDVTGRMLFGCSTNGSDTSPLDGASGVIGFSKGELSLVSQLKLSRFSYYLAPDDSVSVVLLGDQAVPSRTKRTSSTPLLPNSMNPDLYYVRLTGIQVDGQALASIPAGAFDIKADGSGGVVLSTLSAFTYLQEDAYNAVKQAMVSKIPAQAVDVSAEESGIFDLCYTAQSVAELKIPRLTLLFDGGAALELSTVNYFYKNNTNGLQCLTMVPWTSSGGVSFLGNMVQTGTNMIYDIQANTLTFETAAAAPAPSQLLSRIIIAPLLLLWVFLF